MKLSASVVIVSFFFLVRIFHTSDGFRSASAIRERLESAKLLDDDVTRVLDRLRTTLLATESSIATSRHNSNLATLAFVAVISAGDILEQHSHNIQNVVTVPPGFRLGDLYARIGLALTFGTFAGDRALQYKGRESPGCGLRDLDEVLRRFEPLLGGSFHGHQDLGLTVLEREVGTFLGEARRSVRCILEGEEKGLGLTRGLELAFEEVEEAMFRRARTYRRLSERDGAP